MPPPSNMSLTAYPNPRLKTRDAMIRPVKWPFTCESRVKDCPTARGRAQPGFTPSSRSLASVHPLAPFLRGDLGMYLVFIIDSKCYTIRFGETDNKLGRTETLVDASDKSPTHMSF